MTITPVIIPIDTESSKCPSCGKEENIKQTCAHCGMEYKGKDEGILFFVLTLLFSLGLGVYIFFVLIEWVWGFDCDHSLSCILKSHLDVLKKLSF